MDEKQSRWLYFALGVTTVISLGGVVNQVSSAARDSGVILGNDGIRFPDGSLQTTAASPDSRRAFYLTSSTHQGNAPLNACAPGFHFASMWEIHEVSTLRYATDAEGAFDVFRSADSGFGPPAGGAFLPGWARTGAEADTALGAGRANCDGWTSSGGPGINGSTASLMAGWGTSTFTTAHPWGDPWDGKLANCSLLRPVWCVQD